VTIERDHRKAVAQAEKRSAIEQTTYRALVARYGEERATAIMEGRDLATNLDIAAWNNLGKGADRGR
jgi:lipopolysaccharide biosynthesis regulator YciM